MGMRLPDHERLGGPRRTRPITARQREITWAFPGTDCRLIVDVDFDEYGVPHINDVLDAAHQPFPFEEIWFQGKPLEDILIEYICNTPAEELQPG
jgi:hypothetical protein